jgi:hypothetical protein
MARHFDGTDDAIHIPVPAGAATAYSQHGLLNIVVPPGTEMATSWEEGFNNAEHEKYLLVTNTGASHWVAFDGASRQTTPSAAAMASDTWYGQGFTQNATTLTHYFNGVAVGSVAAAGIYSLYAAPVMALGHGTANGFMTCRWAEWALWSEILTAREFAALAKGFSPLLIRPHALLRYMPLLGRITPEREYIEGLTATHVNSPVQYDHPRVIMPRDAIYLP